MTGQGDKSPKNIWSNELFVSFAGGLAANIGLVLLVGGAVALDRLINKSSLNTTKLFYWYMALMAAIAIIGILFYAVFPRLYNAMLAGDNSLLAKAFKRFPPPIPIFRKLPAGFAKLSTGAKVISIVFIWFYVVILGASLVIFLGLAAGLGK